jgi:hypothetical protein
MKDDDRHAGRFLQPVRFDDADVALLAVHLKRGAGVSRPGGRRQQRGQPCGGRQRQENPGESRLAKIEEEHLTGPLQRFRRFNASVLPFVRPGN